MVKGNVIDITGNKYGKLTVVNLSHKGKRRNYYWKCKCDCGNMCVVDGSHLRSGHSTSCGCVGRNRIKKLNYKNGQSATRLYYVYRNMLNRCYRKSDLNYKNYGGRGIRVCDEWVDKNNGFVSFSEWAHKNGYKNCSKRNECTLDRINVDGDYSPSNCRFVDWITQSNNKRNTIRIEYNGSKYTINDISERTGLSKHTVRSRFALGWTPEEIFETKKGARRSG